MAATYMQKQGIINLTTIENVEQNKEIDYKNIF